MKNLVILTIILSFAAGVLSFFPALLITSLVGVESQYAFIYSLMMSFAFMVFIPIPFGISMRREQRDVARIAARLGGSDNCVYHVNISTKRSTVGGYIGFNRSELHLIGKIRNQEHTVVVHNGNDVSIDFSDNPDVCISVYRKKEYHIFTPQASVLLEALRNFGWHVVEPDTARE